MKNRLHFLFKFDIIQKQSKIASVAQQVEQLIRNQQVAGPNPATSSKLLKLTKASQSGAFCLLFAICRFSPFALCALKTSDMQLMMSFRAPCDGDAPVFGVGGRFGIGDLPINNTEFFQNRIVLRTKCSRFESGQLHHTLPIRTTGGLVFYFGKFFAYPEI